jgi:hypothetical protein
MILRPDTADSVISWSDPSPQTLDSPSAATRKLCSFGSILEALDDAASLHRKALWRNANAYGEIRLEKDELAGMLYPVTSVSR